MYEQFSMRINWRVVLLWRSLHSRAFHWMLTQDSFKALIGFYGHIKVGGARSLLEGGGVRSEGLIVFQDGGLWKTRTTQSKEPEHMRCPENLLFPWYTHRFGSCFLLSWEGKAHQHCSSTSETPIGHRQTCPPVRDIAEILVAAKIAKKTSNISGSPGLEFMLIIMI